MISSESFALIRIEGSQAEAADVYVLQPANTTDQLEPADMLRLRRTVLGDCSASFTRGNE